MDKEAQGAYDSYMEALDECIEVASKRAFGRIEGNASEEELLALDRHFLRASAKCSTKRAAWIRVRDGDVHAD